MGHIKNVRIFDCTTSGTWEINKKQSGNSFAGHPVYSWRVEGFQKLKIVYEIY